MVVGQSEIVDTFLGTSISRSFLVLYRLTLPHCWIATAKLIQSVILVLFVPLFRSVAAGSLRQSCPAFFSSFASSFSFRRCSIATAKLSSLFVSFVPLFRPVAAGSLRQSCPAFSYRSCLPFRLAGAGSLRQSCPAHYHRSSSNFRFIFFLLDRYGKAVQL
jgi:hypothetical protein